jgi:hypothetical protein
MEFKIYDTTRYYSSGSLDDVVFFVRYSFEHSGSSAKSGILNESRKTYFSMLPPVSQEEFINNYDLTENTIKGWVRDLHGDNWGSFTSSIETEITNDLNSRTSSPPTTDIWWSSGSQSLDSELLSSGSTFQIYNTPFE